MSVSRTGPSSMDYRITVEDPTTFERAWTAQIPITRLPDETLIYEYACHEGNYGIVNILSAGRADEAGDLEAARLVRQQRIDGGHPGIREPAAPIVPLPKR